jgi:hypothetical protein
VAGDVRRQPERTFEHLRHTNVQFTPDS